jgi:glycerate dehydrogenase
LKIVILDGYSLNPGDLSWEGFKSLGELTCYDRTETGDILNRIKDAEIIITNKTPLTAEMINACSKMLYIGVLATGYNVVDFKAAASMGIPVCNIPTYGTTDVSQFAFALLLNICHRIQDHSNAVYNGQWSESPDFCFWNFPLTELYGKTMGILGYGRIGQATGKIAQALGMNVVAFDEFQNTDLVCESMKYVTLDDLLSESDVISLHCPLFEQTEGIINKKNIAKMKDEVILINTSRGPLIVEDDLAAALNSGKIRAAGLDVVSSEPISKDNILLKAKNCFITPHIAWAPIEARSRLMDIAVENLSSFLEGKIVNRVN